AVAVMRRVGDAEGDRGEAVRHREVLGRILGGQRKVPTDIGDVERAVEGGVGLQLGDDVVDVVGSGEADDLGLAVDRDRQVAAARQVGRVDVGQLKIAVEGAA